MNNEIIREIKYPEQLASLYSKECISYRVNYNAILQRYCQFRLNIIKNKPLINKRIRKIIDLKNLLLPNKCFLENFQNCYDFVCVSGSLGKTTFLILEQRKNGRYTGGIGKSALLYNILGLEPIINKIICNQEKIALLQYFHLNQLIRKKIKIISSDMAFIGSKDGKLFIAPIIGEEFSTQWDLTRHIARKINYYEYEKYRKSITENLELASQKRESLILMGEKLFLDQKYFNRKDFHRIDLIFILGGAIKDTTGIKIIQKDSILDNIKDTFKNNPIDYKTTFWAFNNENYIDRFNHIFNSLENEFLPDIYHIENIGWTSDSYNSIIEQMKEIINNK